MADNTPKSFTILRAKADMDDNKIRDEKIGNVLNELVQRDYKFSMNPQMTSEYPLILVMPNSDTDDYWRVLLESVSTLNKEVSNIIEEDSTEEGMQVDLKNKLCELSNLMNHIVNTHSWKNNELSEFDKNEINSMIQDIKI